MFDTQFLVQAVHFGFRLGDVPVPVRYFDEASQINFRRSTKYGLQTLKTVGKYWLNRLGLWKSKLFKPKDKTTHLTASPQRGAIWWPGRRPWETVSPTRSGWSVFVCSVAGLCEAGATRVVSHRPHRGRLQQADTLQPDSVSHPREPRLRGGLQVRLHELDSRTSEKSNSTE